MMYAAAKMTSDDTLFSMSSEATLAACRIRLQSILEVRLLRTLVIRHADTYLVLTQPPKCPMKPPMAYTLGAKT